MGESSNWQHDSALLSRTFTREGDAPIKLTLTGPDMITNRRGVWRDVYTPGTPVQSECIKTASSQRRIERWFERRCREMVKAGWVLVGGVDY